MTTETIISPQYTESVNIYARIFNAAGLVFDFADNTFKAIGSATTGYVVASELTAMGGTGKSCYSVSVNLANVNNTGAIGRYTLKFYERAGASPADTDAAISGELSLTVRFGSLGEKEVLAQAEISVKSTEGVACQITAWLEHGGEKIDVGTLGGTVFTAAITNTITSAGHGLSDGDVLLLTTSNTLPAGLSTATPYFVINSATDTFELSLTSGGAAVDITDTGTGTHKWHNPTCTVTLREHGSAVNLFSKSMTAEDLVQTTGGTLLSHTFEAEQNTPNFNDDRQYILTVSITENGNTHSTTHNRPVIG